MPNYYRQCQPGSIPYIVRPGDTLVNIAAQYNTTAQAIINVNPGINAYSLQVGQQICVPQSVQQYPACPTTNYYVVDQGDTLQSIADYFNVTAEQIIYSNLGINPNNLYEDMYLCIPVAPTPVRIEVNTGTNRLTVYRDGNVFRTYPVADGKPSTPTPTGSFVVLNKQIDPASEEFGTRWIGLSSPGLSIHGTNNPGIIGSSVTNGDIALNNTDINMLFNLVPVNTPVRIL